MPGRKTPLSGFDYGVCARNLSSHRRLLDEEQGDDHGLHGGEASPDERLKDASARALAASRRPPDLNLIKQPLPDVHGAGLGEEVGADDGARGGPVPAREVERGAERDHARRQAPPERFHEGPHRSLRHFGRGRVGRNSEFVLSRRKRRALLLERLVECAALLVELCYGDSLGLDLRTEVV
eukprot:CAMPEP_0171656606 /NCGR_PEP_ID=MMETSP0990-20121206/41691_1 /TAXON_ID=483369 /ORGANISM="non described non described, Strain CCMP2098" /LENGTH=180 /DNA_ID=CAMNT_0012237131 /DNA_START=221 /DNA_END=764 /DNA_ORIENTATION=+